LHGQRHFHGQIYVTRRYTTQLET